MKRAADATASTWEELVEPPEDDRRELIDGRLVEVDVPRKWHERIVIVLGAHLLPWARRRKLVVLGSGTRSGSAGTAA